MPVGWAGSVSITPLIKSPYQTKLPTGKFNSNGRSTGNNKAGAGAFPDCHWMSVQPFASLCVNITWERKGARKREMHQKERERERERERFCTRRSLPDPWNPAPRRERPSQSAALKLGKLKLGKLN